ncbi:MAG: hydroxymethylglutaryl-CoA reductase, degradative [Flavobacteriaceae bacterium]|nr:hydroxymethylglutaryl-CoA reductase, degradative [Flavobacteriaceae bacterium]
MSREISGFSKLSKDEKIDWLDAKVLTKTSDFKEILRQYWNANSDLQSLHDDFIENTISNFYLPYAVAPNFVINNKKYVIPMVIEESSVVAAAAMVAKFWAKRGGFKTEVISTDKIGQVHFMYKSAKTELEAYFKKIKPQLFSTTSALTKNMKNRGGGILDIELRDKTQVLKDYYQLHVRFETKDSMGANFINSCLEQIANTFKKEGIKIVMSILSNYTPNCLVRAEVSCPVSDLYKEAPMYYAQKFVEAIKIAQVEPYRAVTHNKGIMNGVDAVVIATGNDFRAIEAGVHAYASRKGQYQSLSGAEIKDGIFKFWIELPLSVGTVGGLTALHPLAKISLALLQNPSAKELMEIMAAAGLAQNFAALRALTTKGIQHGHMKMHFTNILNQLKTTPSEKETLKQFFKDKTITHRDVKEALEKLRTLKS